MQISNAAIQHIVILTPSRLKGRPLASQAIKCTATAMHKHTSMQKQAGFRFRKHNAAQELRYIRSQKQTSRSANNKCLCLVHPSWQEGAQIKQTKTNGPAHKYILTKVTTAGQLQCVLWLVLKHTEKHTRHERPSGGLSLACQPFNFKSGGLTLWPPPVPSQCQRLQRRAVAKNACRSATEAAAWCSGRRTVVIGREAAMCD